MKQRVAPVPLDESQVPHSYTTGDMVPDSSRAKDPQRAKKLVVRPPASLSLPFFPEANYHVPDPLALSYSVIYDANRVPANNIPGWRVRQAEHATTPVPTYLGPIAYGQLGGSQHIPLSQFDLGPAVRDPWTGEIPIIDLPSSRFQRTTPDGVSQAEPDPAPVEVVPAKRFREDEVKPGPPPPKDDDDDNDYPPDLPDLEPASRRRRIEEEKDIQEEKMYHRLADEVPRGDFARAHSSKRVAPWTGLQHGPYWVDPAEIASSYPDWMHDEGELKVDEEGRIAPYPAPDRPTRARLERLGDPVRHTDHRILFPPTLQQGVRSEPVLEPLEDARELPEVTATPPNSPVRQYGEYAEDYERKFADKDRLRSTYAYGENLEQHAPHARELREALERFLLHHKEPLPGNVQQVHEELKPLLSHTDKYEKKDFSPEPPLPGNVQQVREELKPLLSHTDKYEKKDFSSEPLSEEVKSPIPGLVLPPETPPAVVEEMKAGVQPMVDAAQELERAHKEHAEKEAALNKSRRRLEEEKAALELAREALAAQQLEQKAREQLEKPVDESGPSREELTRKVKALEQKHKKLLESHAKLLRENEFNDEIVANSGLGSIHKLYLEYRVLRDKLDEIIQEDIERSRAIELKEQALREAHEALTKAKEFHLEEKDADWNLIDNLQKENQSLEKRVSALKDLEALKKKTKDQESDLDALRQTHVEELKQRDAKTDALKKQLLDQQKRLHDSYLKSLERVDELEAKLKAQHAQVETTQQQVHQAEEKHAEASESTMQWASNKLISLIRRDPQLPTLVNNLSRYPPPPPIVEEQKRVEEQPRSAPSRRRPQPQTLEEKQAHIMRSIGRRNVIYDDDDEDIRPVNPREWEAIRNPPADRPRQAPRQAPDRILVDDDEPLQVIQIEQNYLNRRPPPPQMPILQSDRDWSAPAPAYSSPNYVAPPQGSPASLVPDYADVPQYATIKKESPLFIKQESPDPVPEPPPREEPSSRRPRRKAAIEADVRRSQQNHADNQSRIAAERSLQQLDSEYQWRVPAPESAGYRRFHENIQRFQAVSGIPVRLDNWDQQVPFLQGLEQALRRGTEDEYLQASGQDSLFSPKKKKGIGRRTK